MGYIEIAPLGTLSREEEESTNTVIRSCWRRVGGTIFLFENNTTYAL